MSIWVNVSLYVFEWWWNAGWTAVFFDSSTMLQSEDHNTIYTGRNNICRYVFFKVIVIIDILGNMFIPLRAESHEWYQTFNLTISKKANKRTSKNVKLLL